MSDRHHGRLEGFLLTVAVITAAFAIIAGPWGTLNRLGEGEPSGDVQIAEIQMHSARQALALAGLLIAMRMFGKGDRGP